jgi:NADPH:quinone reductase-like Zn-dependent oxidoreductase
LIEIRPGPIAFGSFTPAKSTEADRRTASARSGVGKPIAELPADISAAAALPLAGLTALRMLRLAGGVTGRRILLTGTSGGVGHYVVELAASAGAEVTAISAAPDRGSRLTELGASVCSAA